MEIKLIFLGMLFAVSVEGIRIYGTTIGPGVPEKTIRFRRCLVINRDGGQYRGNSFLRLL